jgi:cytochrome c-type biogenesis protein CcmH
MRVRLFALIIVLVASALSAQQSKVPDAAQFVGPPQGTAVSGPILDQRTAEVAGLLRCPVCQGLSIADSPSEMAVNMKGQVRELLSRGYTQEQILKYFELSYGQFVLLKPKFQGVNTLVWILPILALVIGAVIVVTKAKKLGAAPAPAVPAAPETEQPVEVDPYLARVRELTK